MNDTHQNLQYELYVKEIDRCVWEAVSIFKEMERSTEYLETLYLKADDFQVTHLNTSKFISI